MFEIYLSPNHSLSSVTAEMVKLGLRTRRGRPLCRSHISKLLKHPFYIGKNPWMGQQYPDLQEPLINRDTFEAVQFKMSGKKVPKHSKHNPLFKGLISCEECGGTITWELQKGHWYGHCNGYRNCPKKPWVRQEKIEEGLLERFEALTGPSEDLILWIKTELKERHKDDMDLHYDSARRLKQRHEELTRRIDMAYEDRLDGRISTEKYDNKVSEYQAEQERILAQLENHDSTYTNRLEYNLDLLDLTQKAADIYRRNDKVELRRELLAQIFSNLKLNGQSLDYEYTQTVAIIAATAEKSRTLEQKFEPTKKGSSKAKEALSDQHKTIWLGR
jgi:site-specific DNA recombinase